MVSTSEVIKLELTPEDALAFKEFRRVQDIFSILSDNGVFTTRNGKAIINFNSAGIIDSIEYNLVGYKRGK